MNKPHALVLGLEACWQQPKLSDITVRIIEQSGRLEHDAGAKLENETRDHQEAKHAVPCSKAVLAANSAYFSTHLLSDMYDGGSAVSLVVGEGEADSALAVLRAMYTQRMAQDVTAAELVTMWKIADHLQATPASLCLLSLRTIALDWDAAVMVSRSRAES
jgi:hypothetical protein